MRLEDIEKDAIILADSYLHTSIRMVMLQNKSSLSNITILSLETYLQSQVEQKDDVSFYEYAQTIQGLSLTYFQHVASSYEFIEEVMQFVVQLKKYKISIVGLPQENVYQQELKDILQSVFHISLPIDDYERLIQQQKDFHNLYIVDYNPDIYKDRLYAQLINKGAQRLEKEYTEPKKEFYYVLNKREEVEALARYIIKNNISAEESKLTLLDESYISFVKQIFERYQIPFHVIQETDKNRLIYKYSALIYYYMNANADTLIALIEEEIFQHKYMESMKEYVQIFHKCLDDDFTQLRQAKISYDVIDEREFEKLCALEERAEAVKIYMKESLSRLTHCDLNDALLCVDEIVIEHHKFYQADDTRSVRKIRQMIKLALPYLSLENMDVLLYQLHKIQLPQKQVQQGIAVTSLKNMLVNTEHHFILGASSDNYPKFSSLNGIFSEGYVSGFAYPSLDERYQLHEQNLMRNLCSSEHLVVFYASSSLSGKEQEAALEIETFMDQKPKYYPLKHRLKLHQMQTRLSMQTSRSLFLKDDVLHGSVSALEMYSNCPFKYFVSKGLRIPEPVTYDFGSAKSGTLMHYIFEVALQRYGKDYPDMAKAEVITLLDEKMEEILLIYPHLKERLQMAKENILDSITLNFSFMKGYEEHCALAPVASEYPFQFDMEYDDYQVHLSGFIDRVNSNHDFISIIDYKSSKHLLKENEVLSCLKLQLLTYIVVAAKQWQKRAVGAHYYSFQNKKQTAQYAKYTKTKNEITVFENEDYQLSAQKEKRLEGWMFTKDVEVLDDELTHINGINLKKDGTYSARTNIYNIEKIEAMLYQIYEELSTSIIQGDMRITPVSCAFCKYDSICHYRGKNFERESIQISEDIYIIHKGKEME